MALVDKSNLNDLINERNSVLPSLKRALGINEESFLKIEKIQTCIKYLISFKVSEVNDEILEWLIPIMKNCVMKAFQDNITLSDTSDDEFVIIILKQNLKIVLDLMQVLQTVLDVLLDHNGLRVSDIPSIPINVGELIMTTFEHCRNSSESYKASFNVELLEIFKITQDVHSKFLNLIGSVVIVEDNAKTIEEVDIINKVLDIICHLSETLFNLNMKSCTTNWKGYIHILNKYLPYVKECLDINKTLRHVISEIEESLKSICELASSDVNRMTQIIKLVSFFIRLVLKISDMFWTELENISDVLIVFCIVLHSYPDDFFVSYELPNVAELVQTDIFVVIEPFLQRLMNEEKFTKILTSSKSVMNNDPIGSLYFFNSCIRLICEDDGYSTFCVDDIVPLIFESLKLSFSECYWKSYSESIFDKIVLNLSGVIIKYPQFYLNVERVLIKNVLQDNTWLALLAIDIWALTLSLSPNQFCLKTLLDLLKLEENLDFGVNTFRPEHTHLKCLIKRIYEFLPNYVKSEVVKTFPPRTSHSQWKIIGLEDVPEKEVPAFFEIALINIQKLGSDDFNATNLKVLAETFELLSTLNFSTVDFDTRALVNAVTSLWEVNHIALLNNNVFRFFITKLCKLTRVLIKEFNCKQLLAILNKFKLLSSDNSYKLFVCDTLEPLSEINFNDFGPNEYRISQLMSSIMLLLMDTTSNVVKQNTLELIGTFKNNGKQEIVNDLFRISSDAQREIVEYLNKDRKDYNFDKEYYTALKNNSFEHKCVEWRNVKPDRIYKRPKPDDCVSSYSLGKFAQVNTQKSRHERSGTQFSRSKSMDHKKPISTYKSEDDSVNEAIAALKGDVKCLINVLKTDKLSAKNVSDLKIVANQLMSLM